MKENKEKAFREDKGKKTTGVGQQEIRALGVQEGRHGRDGGKRGNVVVPHSPCLDGAELDTKSRA